MPTTKSCWICGQEISVERLEFVPDTVLCIEHAQAIQKYGGEFILKGVMGNLGKAGSLKKNYGDVEVHKRRNEKGLRRLKQDHEGAEGSAPAEEEP